MKQQRDTDDTASRPDSFADGQFINSVRSHGGSNRDEMSEAEIDSNLEDTFPASDPPAWTLGSDHRPAASRDHGDDAEEKQDAVPIEKDEEPPT